MISILVNLWIAALPRASATPLVHGSEGPNKALARAMTVTELGPGDFEPTSISTLLEGQPPTLQGFGELAFCQGEPSTNGELQEAVGLAESAASYMEFAEAEAALARAVAMLPCLSEPVDAAAAGRAFYLWGIIAEATGDKGKAWETFRRGLLFSPDTQWDDAFSPDARSLFTGVGKELESSAIVSLRVVPTPPSGTLLVDGRRVDASDGVIGMVPGVHLIQHGSVGAAGLTLTLEPDANATLLLPALAADTLVDAAADEGVRRQIVQLLTLAIPEGQGIFLTDGKRTWNGTAGSLALVAGDEPPAAQVGPVPPGSGPSDGRINLLTQVGGAVGGAGLVLVSVSYAQGRGAWNELQGADEPTTYALALERYEPARQRLRIGWVVSASGAVLAGASLLLDGRVVPAPMVGDGTAGVVLTWGSP